VALKFTSEAERQEAVARHADLYQRARSGEITVAELERLSKALLSRTESARKRHKRTPYVREMTTIKRGQPNGNYRGRAAGLYEDRLRAGGPSDFELIKAIEDTLGKELAEEIATALGEAPGPI
jgi:hypothetical protein